MVATDEDSLRVLCRPFFVASAIAPSESFRVKETVVSVWCSRQSVIVSSDALSPCTSIGSSTASL